MTIEKLYDIFLNSTGISTDTRHIKKNNLFFALKGPHFNANALAQEAIEKGANFAVIDDSNYKSSNTILVEDTLTSLQELARHHRQQLHYPIIGLTGSNGKTTTKELIYSVLSQTFKVKCTQGNLNNHIGVPLTLLSFPVDLDIGIVEMGANHQKEIQFLCSISQPNLGLITNFGKAHLEGFGGIEGVIKGKSELYDFLKEHHQTAFINTNDPLQVKQIGSHHDIIQFGSSPNNNYIIKFLGANPMVSINYHNHIIQSHLIGEYNFGNIAVAIAIGAHFKMAVLDIKTGIESYEPDNNRSEIITKVTNTIIMDAYNANPSSMLAALKNFKQIESDNKYLFLGDMFELGEDAKPEHQAIVDYAEEHFKTQIYLLGEHFYETSIAKDTKKFKSFESATMLLSQLHLTNATILIKGSRGMALERLLNTIKFE